PIWPGHPVTAHWGVQDPKVVDDDIQQFHDVLRILNTRIQLFTQLPLEKLQHQKLKQELETIAQH
ncbi:MAG: arsenate reductase ArsC, partial [Thiomicrorhabdus sp.]|nr:arsenate reductase ArsC [Thiomicrorhabdus sp.]